MVSLGNTAFLLSHVRNCFVTGDDTGVCEMLIDKQIISEDELNEMLSFDGNSLPIVNTDDPEFLNNSPEIVYSELRGVRAKSAVEECLTQMRSEQQKMIQAENVLLTSPAQLTPMDIDTLFPFKTEETPPKFSLLPITTIPSSIATKHKKPISVFSRLLEEAKYLPQNPFSEFSRYVAGPGQRLRTFKVYLWDLDEKERAEPLVVSPQADTLVSQFIGLCLFLYTDQDRKPQLNKSLLECLDVFMFEDLDDLDTDFPPLERSDRILRYDFHSLALVNRRKEEVPLAISSPLPVPSGVPPPVSTGSDADQNVVITFHMAQGNSKQVFPLKTLLSDVLKKAMKKRGLMELTGHEYRLEQKDQPGKTLDLTLTLADIRETEFVLVREHSRREPPPDPTDLLHQEDTVSKVIDSLQLQQYRVTLKGMINKEVLLSISDEKIDVEPTRNFFKKQKSFSHSIDRVADMILSHRSSGKSNLRLFYLQPGPSSSSSVSSGGAQGLGDEGGEVTRQMRLEIGPVTPVDDNVVFTSQDFEASSDVASRIQQQVVNILDYRGGKVRQIYLEKQKANKKKKLALV